MYHFCAQTVGSLPLFFHIGMEGGYEHESNPKVAALEKQAWLLDENSNAKGCFGLLNSTN